MPTSRRLSLVYVSSQRPSLSAAGNGRPAVRAPRHTSFPPAPPPERRLGLADPLAAHTPPAMSRRPVPAFTSESKRRLARPVHSWRRRARRPPGLRSGGAIPASVNPAAVPSAPSHTHLSPRRTGVPRHGRARRASLAAIRPELTGTDRAARACACRLPPTHRPSSAAGCASPVGSSLLPPVLVHIRNILP